MVSWEELYSRNKIFYIRGLIYTDTTTYREITYYNPDVNQLEELSSYSFYTGEVFYIYDYPSLFGNILITTILPNYRVAYTHTFLDDQQKDKEFKYTIHIIDLKNFNESVIIHHYTPFETNTAKKKGKIYDKEMVDEYSEKHKYLPALCALIYDRDLIFAVREVKFGTYQSDDFRYPADIFNAKTGNYIRTVEFPFKPKYIKNGYLYRQWENSEKYPIIEKYRIDPWVYGK